MRVRPLLLMLLTAVLGAGVACRTSPPDVAPAPGEEVVVPDSLVLEVENHNWSDIVVSIVHDGVTSRFTEVTAGSGKSVPIPPHLVGHDGFVQLAVRGIGATERFLSQNLSIRTGSTIRLTVESHVTKSSVGIW